MNFFREKFVKAINLINDAFLNSKILIYVVTIFKAKAYQPKISEINEITKLINSINKSGNLSKRDEKKLVQLLEANVVRKASSKQLASLIAGALIYQRTGTTPQISHDTFVALYEKTNGLFQDVLHSAFFYRPVTQSIPLASSVEPFFKGSITEESFGRITSDLEAQGYSKLSFSLSDWVLQAIQEEARVMKFCVDQDSDELSLIDPCDPPNCNVAYASPDHLAGSRLISQIVSHPLLLQIASQYLQSDSKVINNAMWYSFPSAAPSSRAAQFFHYDLDTFKWLKLFIYLTDVDVCAGPHEYVEKSHIVGQKNPFLLLRGYSRIKDDEISKYQSGRRILLSGRKGSMFFGDTRCFHKGNLPLNSYRLILQPIYAPSSFSCRVI